MAKQIAFNEEARRGLERGMNVLADASVPWAASENQNGKPRTRRVR